MGNRGLEIINKLFKVSFVPLIVWSVWLFFHPFEVYGDIKNLQVALTMVVGSFIAGATSTGGGAIAFPVFTKVLGIPAQDAKVFSLAIQSIGMTSACFAIRRLGINVEWKIVPWVSFGGVLGIVFGIGWLSKMIPSDFIRIIFTSVITTFGFVLFKIYQLKKYNVGFHEEIGSFGKKQKLQFLIIGFVGGIISGLIGNGIDIMTFSILVLYFRISVKISTPTSVVLMAINAVAGFLFICLFQNNFNPKVAEYWIAAMPIVVFGAPLGAIVCSFLTRKTIVYSLITLIFIEFISSLVLIPLRTPLVAFAGIIGAIAYIFFNRISLLAPSNSQEETL